MRFARALLYLFILILALLPRLGYILFFQPGTQLEAVDAQGYHILALNLLSGHGLTLSTSPPFIPDAIRTPLYPILVAAVYAIAGPYPIVVALLQAVLDAGTAVAAADIARRLTGRQKAALAAGALYALNPTAWRYSNALFTEIVLAAALVWMVWAFVRYMHERRIVWLSLAAGLCGLSLLVKPNGLLLPVFLALAAASTRPALRAGTAPRPLDRYRPQLVAAALVLAVAAIVVAPWMARNRLVFGRWLYSHAFENNLARVSAVATLVQVQGERVAPWTPWWEAIYSGLILEAQTRYGSSFHPVPTSAREADAMHRQLAAVAGDVVRSHPVDFALAHLGGFVRSWVPQEHRFWYAALAGQTWESLGLPEGVLGQALDLGQREGWGAALAFAWRARVADLPPLAFGLWAGWLAAYAISLVLLVRGSWWLRSRPALLGLVWGIVLYTTFLPGPIAYIRFRVPVAPLMAVLMAVALARPVSATDGAPSAAP